MGIGCSNSKGNRPSDTIKNKETTENRNTIQKIESEISERQENFRSETKESKKKNKKKGKKGQGKKEHEEDYCEEWNGEQDTGLQNAKRENGSKRNEVEGMVKELNEECLKVLVIEI